MRSVTEKTLTGAAIIAAVAYLLTLALWLTPAVKTWTAGSIPKIPQEKIANWDETNALYERFRAAISPASPNLRVTLNGTHPLTPLTEVVFLVIGQHTQGQEKIRFTYKVIDVSVRWGHTIWALAILGGFLLFIGNLRESLGSNGTAAPVPVKPLGQLTLPELLEREVAYCDDLGSRIYKRSTLLLQTALLTIFGGLGALFLLPSDLPRDETSNLWLLLTRPYGIVLLINALALVLLRQYHSLTRDFRYMVSLRWRRVNCLGAVLENGKGGTPQVLEALLAETYPEERLGGAPDSTASDGEMIRSMIDTLKAWKPDGK
jgi:hypothetical protein